MIQPVILPTIFRGLSIAALVLVPSAAWAQAIPASPAQAEAVSPTYDVGPYYAQGQETRRDIEHAREAGQMSKRQARAFGKEARRNNAAAGRYARDGLTASEARELDMRGRALDSVANSARSRQGGQ